MNVSATHGPPFPAANSRPPSATPPAADAAATEPAATEPAPATATSPGAELPATEPVEPKDHGPAAAAGSHRNGVAALRQWINHPSRRAGMEPPDLTAPHHGKGFEKAVAAYQAAAVPTAADPPPTTPPAPTTGPVPVEGG
jgi:hypothetical protein